VLAIYLTAHRAFRLDARVVYPATVVATLLVADAWFDITTDVPTVRVPFTSRLH
jgi:hypothetical protein